VNLAALTRIMRSCTGKVQRNLLRFVWNGRQAVGAFERRLQRKQPFFPAFLMLSITNQCNLRCRGCWVTQSTPPQQLSLAQLQGIISTAEKYSSRFFGILGGEPLFHPQLFTLFENNPQAYFLLFSNGTHLDQACAEKLAALGNVTPLISIEGLENESRRRRGRDDVFAQSLAGLRQAVQAGLFTGVSASINKHNFAELISREYLDFLIDQGVHYLWYYIYRPCGKDPDVQCALDEDEIFRLRQFLVEQRTSARILLIDAYWDAQGQALCPGTTGISHHIAPNGALEFCPVVQFCGGKLNADASNLEELLQDNQYLADMRSFTAQLGRSCVLLESPRELEEFLRSKQAEDSSGRDGWTELAGLQPLPSHGSRQRPLPEKSLCYRLAKKFYFFGFGAYG
jgi:MoaA/NifB/PqqE/SkfB family radical SAM enzyme